MTWLTCKQGNITIFVEYYDHFMAIASFEDYPTGDLFIIEYTVRARAV